MDKNRVENKGWIFNLIIQFLCYIIMGFGGSSL